MASTIITKNGTSGAPANLSAGELAINTTDGGIYYGSTGGTSVSSSFTLGHTTASVVSSSGLITGKELYVLNVGNEGDSNLVTLTSATGNYTINAGGVFSGTSTVASTVTATANNSTDETTYLTFTDGATGTQGIETDTGLTYNPSSGFITASGGLVCAQVSASGKIQTAGAISSSTGITASDAFFSNDITASGAISSSGTITAATLTTTAGTVGGSAIITAANLASQDFSGITAGEASTVATITGLAPDTATTAATQPNITSVGTLTNINTSGHITASGNISSSGNIIAPKFVGQSETIVQHSFYAAPDAYGVNKLINGKLHYGWADRAWVKTFDKSDLDGTGFDVGEYAHHGVPIVYDLTNLQVVASLRPNAAGVTSLAVYLYSGSAPAGSTDNTNHLGFICSASAATMVQNAFNDVYITGSTGYSINAGEHLYFFVESSQASSHLKGTYTVKGERI